MAACSGRQLTWLLRALPQLVHPVVWEVRHRAQVVPIHLVALPSERRVRPSHKPPLDAVNEAEERRSVGVERAAVAPGAHAKDQPAAGGMTCWHHAEEPAENAA